MTSLLIAAVLAAILLLVTLINEMGYSWKGALGTSAAGVPIGFALAVGIMSWVWG